MLFLALLLPTAPILAPASAASAWQAESGEAEFSKGLDAVHLSMERRRWAKAKQQLDALLTAHARRDYVLARDLQVREDMRRIVFRMEVPEPDPSRLVHGELKMYTDRGDIDVVFRGPDWDEMHDPRPGYLSWRTPFTGDYEIQVSGSSHPTEEALQFILDQGRSHHYSVVIGVAPAPGSASFYPARLARFTEGKWVDLDQNKRPNVAQGAAFEFSVSVTPSTITATSMGEALLSGKRENGDHGGFSIYAKQASAWDDVEVRIRGRIETSWMKNKIDAAMEGSLAKFEQSYEPAKHLPDWFLDGEVESAVPASGGGPPDRNGGGAKPPERGLLPNFRFEPGPSPTGKALVAYDRAMAGLVPRLVRGLEEQFAYLEGLESDPDLPRILLRYLNFVVYRRAGLYRQAAESARAIIIEDPAHLETRIGYADAMARTGDPRADGIWNAVADDFPYLEAALNPVAFHFMTDNRLDDAEAWVNERAKDPKARKRLAYVQRILVHARSGPAWGRKYENRTRHYEVASDLDQEICVEAARALESAYSFYSVNLGKAEDAEAGRFRVFLFAGEESYQRYASEAFGGGRPESTAGVYSSLVKQLLIWNMPDREQMYRTILHEGFHQYLDQVMPDPPVWLNEGMAEYFELHQVENGRWREGQLHGRNLKVLASAAWIPLAEFIRLDDAGFREEDVISRNYAMGWALVHFLRNSTRDNRKLFERMFETFRARGGRQTVIEEVFADVDLEALDQALREHAEQLRAGG